MALLVLNYGLKRAEIKRHRGEVRVWYGVALPFIDSLLFIPFYLFPISSLSWRSCGMALSKHPLALKARVPDPKSICGGGMWVTRDPNGDTAGFWDGSWENPAPERRRGGF